MSVCVCARANIRVVKSEQNKSSWLPFWWPGCCLLVGFFFLSIKCFWLRYWLTSGASRCLRISCSQWSSWNTWHGCDLLSYWSSREICSSVSHRVSKLDQCQPHVHTRNEKTHGESKHKVGHTETAQLNQCYNVGAAVSKYPLSFEKSACCSGSKLEGMSLHALVQKVLVSEPVHCWITVSLTASLVSWQTSNWFH